MSDASHGVHGAHHATPTLKEDVVGASTRGTTREVMLEAGGFLNATSALAVNAFLKRQPGIQDATANYLSDTVACPSALRVSSRVSSRVSRHYTT